MGELRVSRRKILEAGAVGALGVALTPQAVFANETEDVELLRWDIVTVNSGVVVAGGTALSKDAATGDTVSLTGSGQANPEERTAAGGGTFVHRHADGTVFASGAFVVTGFGGFRMPVGPSSAPAWPTGSA